MVTLKTFAVFIAGLILAANGVAQETARVTDGLFTQTVSTTLSRDFDRAGTDYLFYDLRGQRIISTRWELEQQPMPVGSLLKPFLAMAYSASHASGFPRFTCAGVQGRCWLPRGHGRLDLELAIAGSCNAYFLQLAKLVPRHAYRDVAAHYGLTGSTDTFTPEMEAGIDPALRITPEQLLHAYALLVAERSGAAQIVRSGMRVSAESGTAKAMAAAQLRGGALAKTGTTVCIHRRHATADGLALALLPAENPRYALLVRMHGVTGATAAFTAGRMLRAIEGD